VVDLTTALAGPYATLLLAGLGARVIKVENPNGGEQSRTNSPYLGRDGVKLARAEEGDISLAHLNRSRGKEAVTLNLKHPAAKEIFADLVRHADLVVENFSSGTLDRLGVGYDFRRSISVVGCTPPADRMQLSPTARRLSLAHLTLPDASPPELVSAAAQAGFDAVGIRLGRGSLPTDPAMRRWRRRWTHKRSAPSRATGCCLVTATCRSRRSSWTCAQTCQSASRPRAHAMRRSPPGRAPSWRWPPFGVCWATSGWVPAWLNCSPPSVADHSRTACFGHCAGRFSKAGCGRMRRSPSRICR
jgi:hypothetical protein